MSNAPALPVVAAIEAGQSQIIRRVEVYESDAITLWVPDPDDPDFSRLVDGSVSVDYSRDERRTLDLTLRNDDKLLRPNALGGLWYDKIIKVFRGVTYNQAVVPPSIAIVEHIDGGSAVYQFRSFLVSLGFTRTDVLTSITDVSDLAGYDVAISFMRTSHTSFAAILQSFYDTGGSVVTISTGNGVADIPHITAATSTVTAGAQIHWGITPPTTDNPLAGTFTTEADNATGTYNGWVVTGIATGAQRVAQWTQDGYTNHITASIASNAQTGRWFDLHTPHYNYGPQQIKLLQAGIQWSANYQAYGTWETQMGEFMIDNIVDQNFPYQVKITGRDYTKKCLLSKLTNAATFDNGTSLYTLIKSLASNAGITKFKLPTMTESLASDLSIDRGTDRWSVMKNAADSFGYEIFFDYKGYLTMRKYVDPSFGAVTQHFQTGAQGNLVSYERSLNDSRLYNHVVVYGDPAEGEEDRLPYFGEARNDEPSSPTRIARIGDRLYTFASTFFTSDTQAAATALAYLKIHSLESYELNVGAIYYPWLEVGEIAEIIDPDAITTDPTRYLMDTITYPLGLGPMSLTAKRVTYVGDSNAGTDTGDDEAA